MPMENLLKQVREVEVLLRLDHPNVVKLFEVFEDEAREKKTFENQLVDPEKS